MIMALVSVLCGLVWLLCAACWVVVVWGYYRGLVVRSGYGYRNVAGSPADRLARRNWRRAGRLFLLAPVAPLVWVFLLVRMAITGAVPCIFERWSLS